MTTRVEPEELGTTRSEKVLAFLLAVFILIGGIWAYFKLEEVAEPRPLFGPQLEQALEPEQREALREEREAEREVFAAQRTLRRERRELVMAREEYRTALDAGRPALEPRRAYLDARDELRAAETAVAAARDRLAAARDRAAPVHEELQDEAEADRDRHDLIVLGLRLALILAMLGGAYAATARLRAARSRYLPAGLAWVGAAGALALVMAVDYTTDVIDVTDVGPLALSLAGIGLTMLALVALQRYISRQIPARRTRRGECPFCGYPLRAGSHCEGCGRKVVAPCASCQEPRRVGAPHCAACGQS